MKIDSIVIACFKKDLHLMRICVASIRYWYPDVDIWLLKDRFDANAAFVLKEITETYIEGKLLKNPLPF